MGSEVLNWLQNFAVQVANQFYDPKSPTGLLLLDGNNQGTTSLCRSCSASASACPSRRRTPFQSSGPFLAKDARVRSAGPTRPDG